MEDAEDLFATDLLARVRARRGRLHLTERLDAASTALVVIDMQRAYTETGAPSASDLTATVIPNINRIAAELRRAGGHVAFSLSTFDDSEDGGWPAFFRRMVGPDLAGGILANLRTGAPLHALDPRLTTSPGDHLFPKRRYSAFAPEASDLPQWLTERRVRTVIVAGTITNVCCESTARDAMQWGFETIMVADANAPRDPDAHRATLATFLEFFGDVLTTDGLLARL
jgi:ureidoacrylate peracid hydrolase